MSEWEPMTDEHISALESQYKRHYKTFPSGDVLRLIARVRQEQARAEQAERERDETRGFVAQSLPYLEEAWAACFNGQKEKLLSAEERGMGYLIALFRDMASGNNVLPPGVVSFQEAQKMVDAATEWAHRLLGNPNDLRPELRDWIGIGNTCADGLARCVEALAVANTRAKQAERERDEVRECLETVNEGSRTLVSLRDEALARAEQAERELRAARACVEALRKSHRCGGIFSPVSHRCPICAALAAYDAATGKGA